MTEKLFKEDTGQRWVPGERFFRAAFQMAVPSTNHLYKNTIIPRGNWKALVLQVLQGRQRIFDVVYKAFVTSRALTPEGKAFKKEVRLRLLAAGARPVGLDGKTPLYMRVWIHRNWWFKNGNLRKADVANYEKALIDAAAPVLEIEDSWFWRVEMEKVEDVVEGWTMEIGTMVPGE